MKNSIKNIKIIIFAAVFSILGCENKPVEVDGSAEDKFVVIDTSGYIEKDMITGLRLIKNREINITSIEYNISFKENTDERGILRLSNICASKYLIYLYDLVDNKYFLSGSLEKDIYGRLNSMDTIYIKSVNSSPVIINEIYVWGSPNKYSYIYDKFIELYNNTDEIQFLDGIIIGVVTHTGDNTLSIMNIDNKTVVNIWFAYQFPGEPGGNKYPVLPRQYVVIAGDAVDHRIISPYCVDLSINNPAFADKRVQLWEFYDQNFGDYDNPLVANLTSVMNYNCYDLSMKVNNDAIIISSGKKGVIYDGDNTYIDLSTILDGVQYNFILSNEMLLDGRIDGGSAGAGIMQYIGNSIERKVYNKNTNIHLDNNNSAMDFQINDRPTPGYQGQTKNK